MAFFPSIPFQQAEKKEKLSTTAASMDGLLNAAAGTTTTATANATSPLMSAVLEQNGVTPPSPSTTPLSEAGSTSGKLLMDSSPDKPASLDGDARLDLLREVKALTINNNNNSSSNNNNKSSSDSCSRVSPSPDKDESGLDGSEQASSNDKGSSNVHCNASNANESTNSTSNNSSSSSSNVEAKEGDSKETESRTTRTLAEELSAKNREVSGRHALHVLLNIVRGGRKLAILTVCFWRYLAKFFSAKEDFTRVEKRKFQNR